MGAMQRFFEDKCVELGSIELAYDAYAGAGAYANLQWNAEDEDEESIQAITELHECFGMFTDEPQPQLNFIHRIKCTQEEWHTILAEYQAKQKAKQQEIANRVSNNGLL